MAKSRGKKQRQGKQAAGPSGEVKRRWRFYKTSAGNSPVRKFLDCLDETDAAEVAGAMAEVRREGLRAARHLQDEIYEARADGKDVIYRVLFAEQGKKGRVLLALDGFVKKTQKTPPAKITLAKRRLRDWEERDA